MGSWRCCSAMLPETPRRTASEGGGNGMVGSEQMTYATLASPFLLPCQKVAHPPLALIGEKVSHPPLSPLPLPS